MNQLTDQQEILKVREHTFETEQQMLAILREISYELKKILQELKDINAVIPGDLVKRLR